jgi:hypothetical protein
MAGLSGSVPSALLPGDIASALAQLQQKLLAAGQAEENEQSLPPDAEDADKTPRVGIRLHAYPLIQLLSAAAKQGSDVMWEEGQPVV